jgi:hypothetical protein
MKYIEGFLKLLLVLFEKSGGILYTGLVVATIFMFWLTGEFHSAYPHNPALHLKWSIILVLLLSGVGVLLILADLLRLSVKPTPTHAQLVDKLRQKPLINDIITGRLQRITVEPSPLNEKNIIRHLEEIMHVVQGEWECVPILEVIKLFVRIALMVALYTLISMNLTLYSKDVIFSTLGSDSHWLSHLYNTMVAMFLVGYDAAFPMGDLGFILGIAEILSGIFALIVVLDFVLTSAYQDMDSFRDALRSYLILSSPTMV